MQSPHIKTELPGPTARALIARDALVVSPSYPREYPFVMSHGRGAEVWDVDGNRFLDFAAGIAVCSTGHSHPAVVRAIQRAAERFIHISSDYWHEDMVRLAERLEALAPMRAPVMSFFAQSGTESVEAALKLARCVTGRSRFIAFLGGFHGRTMGSLALTSSKYTQQKGFFPAMPGVTHVPYPNEYRPLFAGSDQGRATLRYIEEVLFAHNVPAAEVAAIVVEPILGEGGYLVPPDGFLAGLRELCDRHGILLVFDEVQSGIGRTGKMFAIEHYGVEPDLIASAKSLGGGLPIAAVTGRAEIMDAPQPGGLGSTFAGNPASCAAALAALETIETEGLLARSMLIGRRFEGRANGWQEKWPLVGDVRGLGGMCAIELVRNRDTREPAGTETKELARYCYEHGVLTITAGTLNNVMRILMPLVISDAQLDEALDVLEAGLAHVAEKKESLTSHA